jgi:hypothetical protein
LERIDFKHRSQLTQKTTFCFYFILSYFCFV